MSNVSLNNALIKTQQALENGFKYDDTKKTIVVRNFYHGAFYHACIQGNTHDGLRAIHDSFGSKIELNIFDKPNGSESTIKYTGWEHLDVL